MPTNRNKAKKQIKVLTQPPTETDKYKIERTGQTDEQASQAKGLKPTNRQKDRQTDRQTNRQIDR